jgi:MFS family permease
VKIDRTLIKTKFIIALSVTFAIALLSLHAISQMIFGVLGRTSGHSEWSYTVALFIGLLASSLALAIGILTPKNSLMPRIAIAISAAISGALLGIYYGGILAGDKNPQIGGIAAVITALLMVVANFYWRKRLMTIAIIVMGTVATYGLAFLCSSAAFAFLSTDNFLWGSIWGIFCLGAIALTMVFLIFLGRELASYRYHA